jgi:exodeoxyribonuclease VII large subunit
MMNGGELTFGVAEFIAYLNQTLETAYPFVSVEGELSNFRISKNRWVYFDLKDEAEPAMLKCFAVIYALPGPLEDGMRVRISGSPRLHPLYNFSFQVQQIAPVGEGSLKKAADLLRAKLEAEGLFEQSRKRLLPTFPTRIALITAGQSAAYADFIKIAGARWGNLKVEHYDVLVQGEESPRQVVAALEAVSGSADPVEAVVLIRGGGSAEDLAAFNDERVVRAVAASRVPTLVAIGHEVDVSLAELAADVRASTPSNAAELLLPDRGAERRHLTSISQSLDEYLSTYIAQKLQDVITLADRLDESLSTIFDRAKEQINRSRQLLEVLDPHRPLEIGYALIHGSRGSIVRSTSAISTGDNLTIELADGAIDTLVKDVKHKGGTL